MRTSLFRVNAFIEKSRLLQPTAALIVASIFLSACTALTETNPVVEQTVDKDVRIGNNWDSPFGRMGVVPVLPPNEDVRVGDIFVYPFNPDLRVWDDKLKRRVGIALIPRWHTLELLQDLEAEYRLRPDWPTTPDTGGGELAETSTAEGQGLFAGDQVPRRLRAFGTPELNTFVMPEGGVNSLVPSEAINLVFGSAWNDNKAISIRINAAETYSLGLQKVIDAALDTSGPEILLREPYRNHLALVGDESTDSVWVRILSDVVYVRSIDVIIQSKSAFDEDEEPMASEFVEDTKQTVKVTEDEAVGNEPGQSPDSQAAAAGGEDPEDSDIVHTETVSEAVSDHELDPAYAAFVRANAINEKLIETHADDLSAGFLRFVSVTDDSVTVRRVWPRGLAVGARGLSLEVDKFSGRVFRSANMGSLIP
jgi:hypothetical protein